MYGGDTTTAGTAARQEFPVDAESRALFEKEGSQASVTNTWAMEIEPGHGSSTSSRGQDGYFASSST